MKDKNNSGQPKIGLMIQSGRDQTKVKGCDHGIYEHQDIGNSYLITTSIESVLVNAGSLKDLQRGRELYLRERKSIAAEVRDTPS